MSLRKNSIITALAISLALTPATLFAAGTKPAGGGTSAGVSSITAGTCLQGGGTGGVTLGALYVVNPQTGTSYAIQASDACKLVNFSNASAIAVTLPQAIGNFGSGFSFDVQNKGIGVVTVTPNTSTVNGASSLTLQQNQGCTITSDGTNWQVSACTAVAGGSGSISSLTGTSNQIIASPSTGAVTLSLPSALQVGSSIAINCTIGANAFCTNSGGHISGGGSILAGVNWNLGFSGRAFFTSPGAGYMVLGTNAASPVAQTLGVASATGSNANGAAFNTLGSLATGNGINGDYCIQTGKSASTTATAQAVATNAVCFKGDTQRAAFSALVSLKSYTVATLPSGIAGDTAFVTDATTCTFMSVLTGGGSTFCPAIHDGAGWKAG